MIKYNMDTSTALSAGNSRFTLVLTFLLHQAVATVLIFFTATLAVWFITDLLRMLGFVIFLGTVRAVTHPPYFPAQIVWALFLGWSLGGFLHHRVMFWVWVIP